MKDYDTKAIRNVALVAHGGTGKTNLAEAMLYNCKVVDRQGKIADGNTAFDFDPEEIKRQISINLAVGSVEWNDCKINIIDTPGYFDFAGEVTAAMSVADVAIIMVDGKAGVQVGTEKAWAAAEGKAKILFVNNIDEENVDVLKVANDLKATLGKCVAPAYLPIKEGGEIVGYVNVIANEGKMYKAGGTEDVPIPANLLDEVNSAREGLFEAIAETDDALMDKYFNGEEFTEDEIKSGTKNGMLAGTFVPVIFGSAVKNIGVKALLTFICKFMPSPEDAAIRAAHKPGTDEACEPNKDATSLFIFKTLIDSYGKTSYFKVMTGSLKADTTLYNTRAEENEKIAKIYTPSGKKQVEVSTLSAGDIGVVTKLALAKTSDTLTADKNVEYDRLTFPKPVLSLAALATEKGAEEKISAGLSKLRAEDPTFNFATNTETKELIISGMGEQHIDVIVSKLKARYGASVTLKEPKVAYRETIRKKVQAEGKHKKQSGGHGQYGHVKIEFEPGATEELEFCENVFGGSVPKNYFPAVEKGLQECIASGVVAGYPVVNLKATLYDGSYHPVDSSEMAFKMAAHIAFKEGLEKANPVLLEPIGTLKVLVPESYMGDIMGDVNKRRGRILGMGPSEISGLQEVTAEVPMAEMHKYAIDLRSMTQARGSFEFEFTRYEEAPANVAEKVIAESKKEA